MDQQPHQQGQAHQSQGAQQQHGVNFAEIFWKSTARILDIQTAAARALMQTQSRSAAMFGAPDWSELFNGRTGEQLSNFLNTSADQAANYIRQTNDTLREVQHQFGQLVEQQTQQLTEQMRQGMEELGRRGQQGIQEMRRATEQAMHEARQAGNEQQQRAGREHPQPGQPGHTPEGQSSIITALGEQGHETSEAAREERTRSRRGA
jgi:gas vesicle protein